MDTFTYVIIHGKFCLNGGYSSVGPDLVAISDCHNVVDPRKEAKSQISTLSGLERRPR